MAVGNSIAQAQEKKAAVNVTEYQSGGETIKLSPSIIRSYLVSGQGNVSDQEVMMFLSLCRFQHLNPFLREAYLIKYSDKLPAAIVVGKDVFIKRAKRNPSYAGKQAGIVVEDQQTGELVEREGTFYIPGAEKIVGGWAKVYIKGYDMPEYASVSFDEYAARKADGSLNSQWAGKPATMIRKVALVQALREAFPDDFQGMYDQAEIGEASGFSLDESPVVSDVPADEGRKEAPVNPVKSARAAVKSPADALFG